MSQFRKLVIASVFAAFDNPEAGALLLKRGQEIDSQPVENGLPDDFSTNWQWNLILDDRDKWPRELEEQFSLCFERNGVLNEGKIASFEEGGIWSLDEDFDFRVRDLNLSTEKRVELVLQFYVFNSRILQFEARIGSVNSVRIDVSGEQSKVEIIFGHETTATFVGRIKRSEYCSVSCEDKARMTAEALRLESKLVSSGVEVSIVGQEEVFPASDIVQHSDPEHPLAPLPAEATLPAEYAAQEEPSNSSSSDESDENA